MNSENPSNNLMYSKEEILQYQRLADQNIEFILNHFHVKLNKNCQTYVGCCPIHQGADNPTAFNLYHNQDPIKWKCFTHKCDGQLHGTSLGLIRGLLSKQGEPVSFIQVINFCKNHFNLKVTEPKMSVKTEEVVKFGDIAVSREETRKRLKIPSEYFISRGFSKEILDTYDVGASLKPNKRTYWREIVPIYDPKGDYCVGATCRTIFSKCSLCNNYHDSKWRCPPETVKHLYCKWKNVSFKRRFSLYNYWKLPKNINSIIVVESPGNVWRCVEAGIKNVVAIYGSAKLTPYQEKLLKEKQIQHIYFAFDNDEPGQIAFQEAGKAIWDIFNIHKIKIPELFNDIGEMNIEEVKKEIIPQIGW